MLAWTPLEAKSRLRFPSNGTRLKKEKTMWPTMKVMKCPKFSVSSAISTVKNQQTSMPTVAKSDTAADT